MIRVRSTRARKPIECLESRTLLAAATINWNDIHQSIDGFGASSAWNWSAYSQSALDLLFSQATGAGLSLHRAHMYPYGWTSETSIVQQSAVYGVTAWSTPWSPPREWKTNHDNNNGGSLDPAHYQDYANLLATYVTDLKARGVNLYALSLQNEPDWTATYESCIWSASQFAAFLPYVGQTFAAKGITTRIVLPESLKWDFSLASTIMADPSLMQYVGIFAAHNYSEPYYPYKSVTGTGGKPVWETETTLGSSSDTELATAVNLADDIHQALTDGGASAYHYWWFSASSNGGLLNSSFAATKRLWAMGQYSRFVRPGWVLIGESDDGGLDITAFRDPNSGKFAVVVTNTGSSSVAESFTLNGVSAGSVTPYLTSSSSNLAQQTAISLTGATSFSATIAGNSVVTYVGISNSAATLQTPGNLKAAPQYSYGTSRIALSWNDNSSSETAYTVERSTDNSAWTILSSSLAANTTSYVDTGLTENTLYYYRVKATNGSGSSGYASASGSTVLGAPSGIGTWGTNNSGYNLGWSANSTVATTVRIDRSTDGLTWAQVGTVPGGQTYYSDTIPNFDANQIYYYRVRNATSSTISGYASWNSSLKTPSDFVASVVGVNSITFTWSNVAAGASGAWIEQYNSATSAWSTVSPSSLQASDGTWTITGLTSNTAYTFRLKATSMADSVSSGYTSSLVVTTRTPTVPVGWSDADIGSPGVAGWADRAPTTGTWTVVGSGADIWNASDQFNYASKAVSADAELIARVASVSNTDTWAKGGVMFRASIAANSPFAMVVMMPNGEVSFQWRTTAGANAQNNGSRLGGATTGKWVRLVRSGNSFSAYYATSSASPTAGDWVLIGTQAITMPTVIRAGLAVTSHNNTVACTANFTDVSVADSIPVMQAATIDDGAVQRSMVTKVSLSFSEPVALGANAIALYDRTGAAAPNVTLNATNSSGDQMHWDVTFSGSGLQYGSLSDGAYRLTLSAAAISDLTSNPLAMDYRVRFFRLFGDGNGDRIIDATDMTAMRAAMTGSYVTYLDFDGSGTIDGLDYLQIRARRARSLL